MGVELRGRTRYGFGRLVELRSDLSKTLVHVALGWNAPHKLRDASSGRFKCKRCYRDLPDDQFLALGMSKGGKVMYLHPFCNVCRKQLRSKYANHPLVTPALQRYVKDMMPGIRAGARARKLVLALEQDDILGMFVDQGGRCALTGEKLTYRKGSRHFRERFNLSVDRIDSSRHYTIDNVHLVCSIVNIMKSDLDLSEFGHWCKRVVLYSLAKSPASGDEDEGGEEPA